MDEPCSLDPKATEAVEELIWELRGLHDPCGYIIWRKRAVRARCVFMLMGKVVEHTKTEDMFVSPQHQETADYIEDDTAEPWLLHIFGQISKSVAKLCFPELGQRVIILSQSLW